MPSSLTGAARQPQIGSDSAILWRVLPALLPDGSRNCSDPNGYAHPFGPLTACVAFGPMPNSGGQKQWEMQRRLPLRATTRRPWAPRVCVRSADPIHLNHSCARVVSSQGRDDQANALFAALVAGLIRQHGNTDVRQKARILAITGDPKHPASPFACHDIRAACTRSTERSAEEDADGCSLPLSHGDSATPARAVRAKTGRIATALGSAAVQACVQLASHSLAASKR